MNTSFHTRLPWGITSVAQRQDQGERAPSTPLLHLRGLDLLCSCRSNPPGGTRSRARQTAEKHTPVGTAYGRRTQGNGTDLRPISSTHYDPVMAPEAHASSVLNSTTIVTP
jgi:hypothetical protein